MRRCSASCSADSATVAANSSSEDPASRARLAEVRRECTRAKESLSTQEEAAVTVSLPGFTRTVRLGRREFESLVRPALRESTAMVNRGLHGAGMSASGLTAIVLVGGCCRMPIVTDLLRREFDTTVALGTHPEFDVAIGALLTAQPATTGSGEALPSAADAPPAVRLRSSGRPPSRSGRRGAGGGAGQATADAAPPLGAVPPAEEAAVDEPPPAEQASPAEMRRQRKSGRRSKAGRRPNPRHRRGGPGSRSRIAQRGCEHSVPPVEESTLVSAAPIIWTPADPVSSLSPRTVLAGARS